MRLWRIWSLKNSFTFRKETLRTGTTTPLSSRITKNSRMLCFWARIRKSKNWKNGNRITSCLRKGSTRELPLWISGKILGTIRPLLGTIHKGLSRSVTLWRAAIRLWSHRQTMTKSSYQVQKTTSFQTILTALTTVTSILGFWKISKRKNDDQLDEWYFLFYY